MLAETRERVDTNWRSMGEERGQRYMFTGAEEVAVLYRGRSRDGQSGWCAASAPCPNGRCC